MKLENQVVSLELAKKLKELGVKQESLFYWQQTYSEMKGGQVASTFEITQIKKESKKGRRCYNAFTVTELAERMNVEITDVNESESFTLKISNAIDFWCATFGNQDSDVTPQFEDTSLADVLAKMLIYLLENNLIENA